MRLSSVCALLGSSVLTACVILACSGTADLGGTSPDSGAPPRGPAPDASPTAKEAASSPPSAPAPPAPVPLPDALDPDLAMRVAAFVGSCVPDDRSNRILDRMYVERSGDAFEQAARGSLGCFAGKTNGCAAVTDCLGVTVKGVASCVRKCDGNVRVGCESTVEYRQDCAQMGLTCSMAGGLPQCVQGTPPACDDMTFTSTCAAGKPTYCARTEALGPTCSDYGLTCAVRTDSSPPMHLCAGAGPACTSPAGRSPVDFRYDGIACVGATKLRTCVNDAQSVIDCAALGNGFTCQTKDGAAFCGLADECVPGLGVPSCAGSSLVLCNAGKITQVDCTSLGFTGCNAAYGICTPGPSGP